jgi:hypothetical protein
MFSRGSAVNQEGRDERDRRDWRDVRLVGLVYLVEEKHGDLQFAFCRLACELSPMSRG